MTAMQSGSVPPPQATPPITTPPVVSAPTMAAGIEATHGAESAISAETEAAAAGAAPALLSTTPMGGDPDSAMFSAALNACGASYLGVVAEHASQRGLFAG